MIKSPSLPLAALLLLGLVIGWLPGCTSESEPEEIDLSKMPTAKELAPPTYKWQEVRDRFTASTRQWVAQNIEFIPANEWVGQRFVFQPLTASQREFGYAGFRTESRMIGSFLTAPEAEGKAAIVTAVNTSQTPSVTLRFDEEETVVIGRLIGLDPTEAVETGRSLSAEDAYIPGIVLERDLIRAREFVGKTLYFTGRFLRSLDERDGEYDLIDVIHYAPVKVLRVEASTRTETPIRFILEIENGTQGYVDINLSGTNVAPEFRQSERFEQNFLIDDPRKAVDWRPEDWTSFIELKSITYGMSEGQVWAAYGEPDEIGTSVDYEDGVRWIYHGKGSLVFKDGRLADVIAPRRFSR